MTPVWLAGILLIIPPLGAVAVLVGALYAIYLTYLALPRTLECPEDKTIAFTAVIVVVAVVVNVVLQMIVSSLTLAGTSFSTPRF
jgi:hypothetical protein